MLRLLRSPDAPSIATTLLAVEGGASDDRNMAQNAYGSAAVRPPPPPPHTPHPNRPQAVCWANLGIRSQSLLNMMPRCDHIVSSKVYNGRLARDQLLNNPIRSHL